MPKNNARKQHIRTQQLPGESYTAAMRRLENVPVWDEDGQGLGTTEYTTTIEGADIVVVFTGDHKAPWLGYWNAYRVEDENQPVDYGRVRFTDPIPTTTQVDAALAGIARELQATLSTGTRHGTTSTDHGDRLAPEDAREDAVVYLELSPGSANADELDGPQLVSLVWDDEGTTTIRLDLDDAAADVTPGGVLDLTHDTATDTWVAPSTDLRAVVYTA